MNAHALPPSSFLGSRADRIELARQRFFEEGLVPPGVVSEPVFLSWSRCLRLGLRPGDQAMFEPVTASVPIWPCKRNVNAAGLARGLAEPGGDAGFRPPRRIWRPPRATLHRKHEFHLSRPKDEEA